MADSQMNKRSRPAIVFSVFLVCFLLQACVSIDADFFISIERLKTAWGSEEKLLLPAKLIIPSSAKAKNCQESAAQLNPVLHKYFNNPEVKYCGTLTRRTVTDENGRKAEEYNLKKNEFMTGYHSSPGSGESSYGVMVISSEVPLTHETPSEEFFSFSARKSDDAVIIRMYVNKELHQSLANEVQQFSNVQLSVKDGDALLPHLGRFNIELDNDSGDECHIEFEGQTSTLKPSEKKRFSLNYTVNELYGNEGIRALAIGGCLF